MKQENPFSALIDFMQHEGATLNPPSIALGTITSVSPIKISLGELTLESDDILISDFLLIDYERTISINEGTPQKYKTKDTLKVGDVVAMFPTEDRQTFIVISKVVSV